MCSLHNHCNSVYILTKNIVLNKENNFIKAKYWVAVFLRYIKYEDIYKHVQCTRHSSRS